MQIKKQISVLIPAYKATATVERAIESALDVGCVDIILAPDDGSGDYFYLASKYSGFVTVLPATERSGPGAARNRAYQASTGEFITMLDADDQYAPGALSEALGLAQMHHTGVAFFRTAYIDNLTGSILRELKYTPILMKPGFVKFCGSIHAIFNRKHWTPYDEVYFAEDVLHDAKMLIATGGEAPLTMSFYENMVNSKSLCSTTEQERINRDYIFLRDGSSSHFIRDTFAERLKLSQSFEERGEEHRNLNIYQFANLYY